MYIIRQTQIPWGAGQGRDPEIFLYSLSSDKGESHQFLFVTNVKDQLIAYIGDSIWKRDEKLRAHQNSINHITW